MSRLMINDHAWSKLAPVLKNFRIHFNSSKVRLFLEAVLYRMRVGCPWRDLPKDFGNYSSVFNKFNRWSKKGFWVKIFEALKDVDNEWVFVDSTTCKAHKQACCIKDKKYEAIGKSVGGHTTKIHAFCDSHGNLITFTLTGGNTHDAKPVIEMIEDLDAEHFVADKAYHSEPIRKKLREKEIKDVIPIKSNSKDKTNSNFDSFIYRHRHLVENFFCRIKEWRSISTRFEKSKRNYEALIYLGAAYLWCKI